MKKLMIAAAAAATAGSIFGATAQVYDMTITVKSTECKDNKKLYKNVCADDIQFYRAQATQKFYGKFWGCGCETLCAPTMYGVPRCGDQERSFVFWGAKGAFHDAQIDWPVLQLVGKNGTNVEGSFNLDLYTCEDGTVAADPDFSLAGAGYGTASVVACGDKDNYVKSMSGSVVGVANVAALSAVTGCKYCGDTADCNVWDYCDCVAANNDVSAAFGTFTLKYNASQAKALAKGKWIDEANKFKSFVTDEFACIAAGNVPPAPVEPSAKEVAQKNYAAAQKALEEAEKALDDLNKGAANCEKGKELAKAVADATTAQATKAAALTAAAGATAEITDVDNAQAEVDAAADAVVQKQKDLDDAVTQTDVAAAKAALEAANKDLDDANKALANAKKTVPAADADKLAAYEKALAESKAADKAKDAADKAKADWDTNDMDPVVPGTQTGYDLAHDAAVDAHDKAYTDFVMAKIQCAAAGAECK